MPDIPFMDAWTSGCILQKRYKNGTITKEFALELIEVEYVKMNNPTIKRQRIYGGTKDGFEEKVLRSVELTVKK
ncbi:MAG: hypothetical protein ACLVI9_04235 [Anaerostipes hadrus]